LRLFWQLKLLGDLGHNFVAPASDLVAHEVDVLLSVEKNIEVLLNDRNFIVEFQDLLVLGRALVLPALTIIDHFKLMQNFILLIVGFSEVFELLLVLRYCREELRICLLSSQELFDHLLDVRVSSTRPDFLERLLNIMILFHFTLHLFLEVCAPKLVDHEVCPELNLILIFVFVCSGLCDLRLSLNTVHSLLEGILLVLDTQLQRNDSLLPFLLLVIDVLHKGVETIFALELMFLCQAVLDRVFFVNLILGMKTLNQIV